MRHNKKFNHLSRTSTHRKALLSNMASSLIEHKRISTTLAKAKELRTYVEPLITRAKNDTTHSRRVVFSHLQNKEAVSELFRDVAEKIVDRPGGYTRILRTGNRLGDNAEMCIIELVDYNEAMLGAKEEEKKPKRRRSRRGGSGKKSETAEATAKTQQSKTEVIEEKKPRETKAEEENIAAEAKAAATDVETADVKRTDDKAEVKEKVKSDATAEAEAKPADTGKEEKEETKAEKSGEKGSDDEKKEEKK